MDEFTDLLITLRSQDDEKAASALSALRERSDGYMHRYLGPYLPKLQDREDVVAEVFIKIWQKRAQYQIDTRGQWYALIAMIGKRKALDLLTKKDGQTIDIESIPAADLPYIEILADLFTDRELVIRLADGCWLDVDPEMPQAERNRRRLALQLFYLHDMSWDEICEALPGDTKLTRETLDSWLSEVALQLYLAFTSFYIDNDALTGEIIDPAHPLSPASLDKLRKKAQEGTTSPIEGWTCDEILLIMLRYRNALNDDKILQMSPHVSSCQLSELIKKSRQRMSFDRRAKSLKKGLEAKNIPTLAIAKSGLWRRLAFQYHVFDDIPQKHILERIDPLTNVLDAKFTAAMLTVGISSGRFFQELAQYAAGRGYAAQS